MLKMEYIIPMKEMMKKESIFTVTFTDGGEVFIKAMDEAHARRIIENNGLWRRNTEDEPFARTIKKVEKSA
jgi:GTP-dependent phosphoenolpyruvate carboxykinase